MLANLDPFTHANLPYEGGVIQFATLDHPFELIQGNRTFLLTVAAVVPVAHFYNHVINEGKGYSDPS